MKYLKILILSSSVFGCDITHPTKSDSEKVSKFVYEAIHEQVDKVKKEPEFRPEVKILYHFSESPSSEFEYVEVNGMVCLRWYGSKPSFSYVSGISCNWDQFSPYDLPLDRKEMK